MKNKKRVSLFAGSVIVFLIIITPYLMFLYKSVPDVENWKTFLGVIKGGYYDSAQNYIYWFFSKFVPLLLLIIWFLTCKHWWVHAIIIPISVYLFQLITVINDSEKYIDEVEFIYTVPITVLVITIMYYLRSKLAIFIQAVDLKKEMDDKMQFPPKKAD